MEIDPADYLPTITYDHLDYATIKGADAES